MQLRSHRAPSWFESLGHSTLVSSHIGQRCKLVYTGCHTVTLLLLTLLGSARNSILPSSWAEHYNTAVRGGHRSMYERPGSPGGPQPACKTRRGAVAGSLSMCHRLLNQLEKVNINFTHRKTTASVCPSTGIHPAYSQWIWDHLMPQFHIFCRGHTSFTTPVKYCLLVS